MWGHSYTVVYFQVALILPYFSKVAVSIYTPSNCSVVLKNGEAPYHTLYTKVNSGVPYGPVVKTLLSLQRAQIQPLVGELRSWKPHAVTEKKNIKRPKHET